ncbi:hypothetical protein [Microvirga yunnanensis]|uniref:hypothetical protein n=1 Tax=Microvirga yunnanensis TaxID=2953740 RepID=UPI0021C5B989|nr:hypothetical protein [Microvirga sp. HBU65207]
MNDLQHQQEYLILADRHLAEGEERVAGLTAYIDRLARQGADTTSAENLLTVVEQTLVQWEGDRSITLDAIARREQPSR